MMIETRLTGQTPDLAQDNIEKLKSLFPDIVTDGKIDFDKLKQDLGDYVDDSAERYNFSWNGKGQALRLAQTPSNGTLRPCKEESKDWDTTQNLYIEGDNLEVLKLLQKSYHSKVKMIYIDPPYNTGNDFVYPDNFKDSIENYRSITGQTDSEGKNISSNSETSGRYHTDWLNMMYPRLRLARNLLTDDGVIFISIDDNEVDNLKKICNEIFGEDNFFTTVIVQSNKRGQTYKQISKTHEYLLIYTKSPDSEFNEIEKDGDSDDLNLEDSISKYNIRELRNRNPKFGKFNRPNLFYPIYVNKHYLDKDGFSPVSMIANDDFNVEVLPFNSSGIESCWRWGKILTSKNIDINTQSSNLVAKVKADGRYNIYEKYRKTTYKPKTIWQETEVITEKGTIELGELGLSKFFDFPKPIQLIKKAIQIGSNQDDIILDFFSGSSTTAHSLIKINDEDGGNRKFIMVQLPEPIDKNSNSDEGYKNICEIGKERIRRAGEKIKEEKGLLAQNLDIGFKVLKLDTSNIRKWQPNGNDLESSLLDAINNYVDDRTELDVVYEIMLKFGLDLTYSVEEFIIEGKKVYSIGYGVLMICLDNEITTSIAKGILEKVQALAPETTRVVFKDNGFKTDSNKTNIKEILKCGGIDEFITL